jgi:hypothetical protein
MCSQWGEQAPWAVLRPAARPGCFDQHHHGMSGHLDSKCTHIYAQAVHMSTVESTLTSRIPVNRGRGAVTNDVQAVRRGYPPVGPARVRPLRRVPHAEGAGGTPFAARPPGERLGEQTEPLHGGR